MIPTIKNIILIYAYILAVFVFVGSTITNKDVQLHSAIHAYAEYNVDYQEVKCLADNIYHEANGEPKIGMIAVAEVTVNRINDKRFPDTICGVVYQKSKAGTCQFSWVCTKKIAKTIPNTPAYRRAIAIAENIVDNLDNYNNRIVSKSTMFYHNITVRPKWSYNMKKEVRIDRHIFYKDK